MPQPPDADHRLHPTVEACPACRARLVRSALNDYACPKCGRLLDRLYRAEHRDRAAGRRLTFARIRAEYRAAGMPLPGWLP